MKLSKTLVVIYCLSVLVTSSFTQATILIEAYYPFGEAGSFGDNNKPLDLSGNGRAYLNNLGDAAISATAPSPFSSANYDFNGNGYYDIGYGAPEDNVGVQGWFRVSDFDIESSHIFGTGHDNDGLSIRWNTDTNLFEGALGGVSLVGDGYAAVIDTWVHLALVRNAGTSTFYVNGLANGASINDTPIDATESHLGLSDGAAAYFRGSIDEGAFFTFTSGEFVPTDLAYNKKISSTGPGDPVVSLYAEYHLGEGGSLVGTGKLPQDSSVNGRHYTTDISGANATILTAGVTAPGSTAFLSTTDTGWTGDIYGNLPTNNFGVGVYVQAAENSEATQGDFFFLGEAGGGFGFALEFNGWSAGAHSISFIGPEGGAGFTANTWVHLALIRANGVTTFYIDGVAQSNPYNGGPIHGTGYLGTSPDSPPAFDGFFDEARIVTFTPGTPEGQILSALTGVPNSSNTYATWIAGFPQVGTFTGFNDDFDQDGLDNGVEQFLGSNPSVANQGLTQVSSTFGSVQFSHSRTNSLATDVAIAYEWSTNLQDWFASGATSPGGLSVLITTQTTTDLTAPANDTITVNATPTSGTTTKLFVRLKATGGF